MFYKDAQQVYRVEELERFPWLDHGFGTKLSEGWPRGPLVWARQIHSAICLCADDAPEPPEPGRAAPPSREPTPAGSGLPARSRGTALHDAQDHRGTTLGPGDALISNTPGRLIGIRTADCIPILLVDERLRAIAAVHAGWRGSAQQIAVRAVEALGARYDSRPEDLVVAIGPGICGKCYTVGGPVAAQFRAWFPERTGLDRETSIDLTEANRRQLVAAGVAAGRIYTGAPCTCCQNEEFYSHRRSGGQPERMISAIGILPRA